MSLPAQVRVVEVGPRDGLQNEATPLDLADRLALVQSLAEAGLEQIETGSFVSPRWVPQMAGSAELFAALVRKPGVIYSALVPNLHGLEAALAAGVDEVAVFGAASETFSQRNINCSIAESLARFAPVIERAQAEGVRVRGYVSCVLGCPYEGRIAPQAVAEVARALYEMGCYEISLGDTIGVGTPADTRHMLHAVGRAVPREALAGHFHDTYGQGLANVYASLLEGVGVFDASVAGLGGCPYAAGASGNLATEDLVYLLQGMGYVPQIDLAALARVGRAICERLGRETGSRVGRAIT